MNVSEKIKLNSKLRGLFFLKILYHLSIEMRSLLATEVIPLDAIKSINEINHRLYPALMDVISNPESCMQAHTEMLIVMLEKLGFSELMKATLNEIEVDELKEK